MSYLTLRRVVGLLGVALPFVLALWGFALQGGCHLLTSISAYYQLRTRDVLVGTLFTIGWFLFAYRGYERQDGLAGNLACAFAIGVALFHDLPDAAFWEKAAHYTSAACLFLTLAYFSYCLFTKTNGPTPEKLVRNRIYKGCAITIVACLAGIAVCLALVPAPVRDEWKPVFVLESLALFAFGFSWFVKGETLWRDRG